MRRLPGCAALSRKSKTGEFVEEALPIQRESGPGSKMFIRNATGLEELSIQLGHTSRTDGYVRYQRNTPLVSRLVVHLDIS